MGPQAMQASGQRRPAPAGLIEVPLQPELGRPGVPAARSGLRKGNRRQTGVLREHNRATPYRAWWRLLRGRCGLRFQ